MARPAWERGTSGPTGARTIASRPCRRTRRIPYSRPTEALSGDVLERGFTVEQDQSRRGLRGNDPGRFAVLVGLGRDSGARIVPARRQAGPSTAAAARSPGSTGRRRAGCQPVRVVAKVESTAFVDAQKIPVRVDDEGKARPALHGRIGGAPVGLQEDRRCRGNEDPWRVGLQPDTSVMRFCSARLAVTRASGTVIGPVGSSLPVSTESADRASRPRPEKSSSVL